MNTGQANDLWDISNRPHTKTKLEILRKWFGVWLTIWNNQNWASREWYVMDLFAGRGTYADKEQIVSGSPLIYLETIAEKRDKLRNNLKIKLFLVERDTSNFRCLKENVDRFIEENPQIKNMVKVEYFNDDCNEVTGEIISQIENTSKHPLFVFIDPYGLDGIKATEELVELRNPKDIMFNYMLVGVRRASGIARKAHYGAELTSREIKTAETLMDFLGDDIDLVDESGGKILDTKLLIRFASLFTSQGLKVVAYDMPYPDRKDVLYYLLFASRKPAIANIVKDIYARQKESPQLTLFEDFHREGIITVASKVEQIERKSLLYETGVEYGNWTINHVLGCMHGCRFPCYAYMMSKRFGRSKSYDDWVKPRIVANALKLLEKEIPKYKDQIDFVHLSFMTDPFMYDSEERDLVPEIKALTLEIVKRLNKAGIRVTILTKGFYPSKVLDSGLLKSNEYGITLVSLSSEFKQRFEPFSAPYEKRIDSLKKLSDAGCKTWVSIEPYPTPNLDETCENGIGDLLEKVGFVDKIVFGKLNYNVESSKFPESESFYRKTARTVIDFCERNGIKYHIKLGTPYSKEETKDIFREENRD
ncbi:three-Cys-motif partner protein TcmP [Candidatus Poribacteria bacterium]